MQMKKLKQAWELSGMTFLRTGILIEKMQNNDKDRLILFSGLVSTLNL